MWKFEYATAKTLADVNALAADGWRVVPMTWPKTTEGVLMERLVGHA